MTEEGIAVQAGEPAKRGASMWSLRGKPFAQLVVFGGLLYFGIGIIALIVPLALATGAWGDPLTASGLLFGVIFLVAAVASLTGKRWSFLVAAILSVLIILLFSGEIVSAFSNPASPSFWFTASALPGLILVLIFGILSFANAKKGLETKSYLAHARSTGGLLAVAVIGFVIGSLVIGAISGANVARILQGAGTTADVRIVPNAADPSTSVPFSPASFTVSAGGTVSWYNGDTNTHSVTSDSGAFESGNLAPGARWSHTFAQPGTYAYHCTPHPLMTGTIVVT